MLKDIVKGRPLGQHQVYLHFEDGAEGEVDIAGIVQFTGILAPPADPAFFAQATADPETGTSPCPTARTSVRKSSAQQSLAFA